MSAAFIALLFGLGSGAWVYTQLAKRNGNASPANNAIAAGFIAFIIAVIFFCILKFALNF